MLAPPPDRGANLVAGIVRASVARPWLVVVAGLLLTVLAGVYSAGRIAINTDPLSMLSPTLQFRQDFETFKREFPALTDTIAVVIDGADADKVAAAADALAARLNADRKLFQGVFYPEGDEFFGRNGLLYSSIPELQALATRLAEAQPMLATVARDPSVRGLAEVLRLGVDALGSADAEPARLAQALDLAATVIDGVNTGRRRVMPWQALMRGPAEGDSRRRFIIVRPVMDFASMTPAGDAIDGIRRHMQALGLGASGDARVRLTGSAAIDSEEISSIAENTSLSGIVSTIAVGLLLILCFRSAGMVISALLTLGAGIVWTTAFGLLAIGSFNMISVAFAVLFIGIGIDFGIHVGLRFMEVAEAGADRRAALVGAGRSVGTALLLMALGAAVGFFAFLPTDYRGVSELGLIAGFGMVAAFLANITVYPALIAIWPGLRAKAPQVAAKPSPLPPRPSPRRKIVLIGSALLGIASLAFAGQARFDSNPLHLKDPSTESVATALELLEDQRLNVSTISVLVDRADAVRPLAERLRRLPSVGSVRTIDDYVPADQDAKLEILQDIALQLTPVLVPAQAPSAPDAAQRIASLDSLRAAARRALTENRAGAAADALRRLVGVLDRFLGREDGPPTLAALDHDLTGGLPKLLAELKQALDARKFGAAELPAGLRERVISPSGLNRIEVIPRGNVQDSRALRRFVEEVTSVAAHATDGPVVELRAGDAIVHAFVVASLVALGVVALGLFAALRRLLDVALILAPIALAASLTLAIAVAAGLTFNFANVIVVPLLIGLGVSSAVHLVVRSRRDRTAAVMRSSTPRAVLFSALTTIASFASLALSSHWGQASMGLLLLIAMSVNLLCFLVVLPALLSAVEARSGTTAPSALPSAGET